MVRSRFFNEIEEQIKQEITAGATVKAQETLALVHGIYKKKLAAKAEYHVDMANTLRKSDPAKAASHAVLSDICHMLLQQT